MASDGESLGLCRTMHGHFWLVCLFVSPLLYSVLWEADPAAMGSLVHGMEMWMVPPLGDTDQRDGGRKMRLGIYFSGSVHFRTAVCCCFASPNITSVEWLSPIGSGRHSSSPSSKWPESLCHGLQRCIMFDKIFWFPLTSSCCGKVCLY